MRSGTPGFVGARLREGREARRLSVLALADMLGVSKTAIYQYETGSQTPGPEVMEEISSKLGIPTAYFCKPAPRIRPGDIFWRSMVSGTKTARAGAEKRYFWLQEIVQYLRQFVQFPAVDIPEIDLPADPMRISDNEIENAAQQARSKWGVDDGPIDNMVWLLERNGVIVNRDDLEEQSLDAFSELYVEDGTPYVVLGTQKDNAVRSRFDAAHELAHLVLHQRMDRSQLLTREVHKKVEAQAHRFAGAFLLPAHSFADECYLPTLDTFALLKPKWKVSIAMMARRAHDLDLITSDDYKNLCIGIARRKWRLKEPYDDKLKVETPVLLTRALELLLKEKIQSRFEILSSISLSPVDIERFAGLSGLLTSSFEAEPKVKIFPFPRERNDQR